MLSGSRGFRALAAWIAVAIVAFGLSVSADVRVDVSPSEQEAEPGDVVTAVFSLQNDGPDPFEATIELAKPARWEVYNLSPSTLVPSEGEELIFATIAVPGDAMAGPYTLTLTATSAVDPTDARSASAVVVVAPVNEIQLLAPEGSSVAPGGAVVYELTLVNRGNAQDSILIDAVSSRGLLQPLAQSLFDLAPQESATVAFRLEAPAGTDTGQDVLTVTATSTLYDGVEVDAVVFTTILPPTPDTVGGALIEILPGRFRLSIGQDVFDGSFDSRMTFSTSGRVLDGFFSAFLSVDSPLGPDPLDVTSYSILYRREPGTATIGNVSKTLTELVGLTCEGGSFELDDELLDVIVVGGLSDDEARFAGLFALGPEEANVALVYSDFRTPTSRNAIAGTKVESEPIEDWRLYAEGALGTADGLSSRALFFGTEIDTSGYFLSGEVFSIGTAFPGSGQDSAGISLSQRLRLTDLSISLSLGHRWDNVDRDPLLATVIDDELGFNLAATPIEDGPRVSATLEFDWTREDDLAQRNEIDLLLSAGVRETDGVFPYTFSGETQDRIDVVLGTHTRTYEFTEGAGLSVDSFYLFLQLTQEKTVDVVTDTVLSGGTDVSLRFRPEGTLHEASISLSNTEDDFDLSATIDVQFNDWLDISFDGSIGWDRADATPMTFGWGITFSADLLIPLPFLVTKGQLEGRLFVDVDADGVLGPNDRPIAGGVLAINGTEVSTDATGLYRFPPLPPGTVALSIRNVPPDVEIPEAIDVTLVSGEKTVADLPLRPILFAEGIVFDDTDQDGAQDASERGFADMGIVLTAAEGGTRGALTDAFGRFTFFDVDPGAYTVSLDPTTLPARFEFTTAEALAFDVTAESVDDLAIGGFIRPREVIITFQPPTADFTFEPAAPTAGTPVTFDGSLSFDFDGVILAYAWDFDEDGVADATGASVEWTFATPGSATVSLTVTDDTGNGDTLIRNLDVGGEPTETEPAEIDPSSGSFQPPIADFSFAPELPAAGELVAFDGSLSVDFDGRIASYAWDFNADGTPDASGATAMRTFAEAGTYEVRLTVTDDAGNADTVARSIEVGGGAPPEEAPTEEPPTETPEEPSEPVDVRPSLTPPTADFSYAPGSPIAGEPITFDGTPSSDPNGEIVSYAWDFDGDGLTDATEAVLEYTFPASGSYSVALTVVDAEDASDTVVYVLTVGAPASGDSGTIQPPIAMFTFSPETPIVGEPVEFNGMYSLDFDGVLVAYQWDFDGNGVTDATGPIVLHAFAVAGTYTVRLTVVDDDGATDAMATLVTAQ